jgi:hypothetical protein
MVGQRKPEPESKSKCTKISVERCNEGPRITVVTCGEAGQIGDYWSDETVEKIADLL